MDLLLRIFLLLVGALVFSSVIAMLIKRNLNESNSFLWLVIAFVTLISGIFPRIYSHLAAFLRIDYPPTLLFLASTVALLLISFKDSMNISKTEARLNELAITLSIIMEDNKRLTAMLNEEPSRSGRKENEVL